MNRINVICEVYGTSLERLRRLKPCLGNDKKALVDIARYLRNEEHKNYSEIADTLFRDRSTIKYYLNS